MKTRERILKIFNETSWDSIASRYEPHFGQLIDLIVQPGWICVDIGAAVGLITERLALKVGPQGYVYAFEAHPENARILENYMTDLGYSDRVKVENTAVANKTRKLWLFPGRGRSAFEWNIIGHDVEGVETQPELEIDAIALDDYFSKGTRLDLIKIDIEGAAGFALAGMKCILHECRPILLIEFHNSVEWQARNHLYDEHYKLWDLVRGDLIVRGNDVASTYHCCAIPSEFNINLSFSS